MNRRDTFKTLLISTLSGGAIMTGGNSCQKEATTEKTTTNTQKGGGYGRTPKEQLRDETLKSEQFFNAHELTTIAVLCDIILPKDENSGSATDAEVPAFIEFIVKDLPYHQLPLRGGLMWIDGEAKERFDTDFQSCTSTQQIEIVEDIACPALPPEKDDPLFAPGIKFFSLLRNLTLTGFYTTKMGIEDLGYKGNSPTVWDGVPADVLADHEVEYDPVWLAKCIDQDTRETIATWDDKGNLLS